MIIKIYRERGKNKKSKGRRGGFLLHPKKP
jgi:hypothetical protein